MISITIICKNEENNIEECIKSALWADEIIVVDSYSTDKTVEIAKKFTDKIYQNGWKGFAEQRNFALSKTTKEWIMPLDADERCSPELKEEIIKIISGTDIEESGFRIPRKSFILYKWVKHCGWYPGYQLRLFRSDKVKVTERLVHEGYEVEGKIGFLKNDILHYTINSISEYILKINQYSSLQAIEKADKKIVKLSDLFFRPIAAFLQQFIFKKGFLDGVYGLMVTNFDIMTNMLTYMKMWEIQHTQKTDNKKQKTNN
jgi:glycosyltransferase involved in cell wall biosynthesis